MRTFVVAALMAALALPAIAQDTRPRPRPSQEATPSASPLPPAVDGAEVGDAPGGLLRGLDKVTGHAVDFDLQKGQSARFGRITIELGECRYPADDPASNAYAWVTVLYDAAPEPVFQGWMIASSPALNAMDHQRYDVWLIRCTNSGG